MQIIEADDNDDNELRRLILLQFEYDDEWKVLDVTNNKYLSGSLDQTCECYRNFHRNYGYNYRSCTGGAPSFRPENLTIRTYAHKRFPNRLFRSEIFSQLQHLRVNDLEISEFHASMLFGANRLKTLDLSRNALEELPAKAFVNGENLIEIDLSYNQIARMPSDVFMNENTTPKPDSEYLKYEMPSSIENSFEPLDNLKIIRLNNNYLAFIDPNWFGHLKNLEIVSLNDNLLAEIDVFSAFQSNTALRSLHLQNNNFSNIITNVFKIELESFDISNNPTNNGTQQIQVNAKTISIRNTNSQKCFIPFNAVILYADHNRIDSISINEIPNTNLQELYLSHNEISSADFLTELQNLHIADLSHNILTQISATVFENSPNLTTLNLSHNKFVTIDLIFIEPAMHLAHLDISNNQLSGHFNLNVETNALASLNIANNKYTSVQQNLRKHAANLQTINLNGNDFDCDELTSTILFLNFDHITTIVPSEDTSNYANENNVKGIRCHTISNDNELIIARLSQDLSKRSYSTMKNDVNKSLDDKLTQLESRLIELIKNVMPSKTEDTTYI